MELDRLTRLKDMGNKCGDEGWICIQIRLEDVRVNTLHMFHAPGLCVDRYRLLHDGIEPSYLVKAEEMVDVVVCMEDAVAPGDVLPESLLPEIRGCVDQEHTLVTPGIGEPGGRARAGSHVSRVLGSTCCAIACDCGDAGRGA